MKRRRRILDLVGLLCIATGALACGDEGSTGLDDPAGCDGGKCDGALDPDGGPVQVLDYDRFQTAVSCSAHCVWNEHFWVDVAVADDAPDKEVGIIWTDDNGETSKTVPLSRETDLGDGFERWGVDVEVGSFNNGSHPNPLPEEITFTAFAKMNGETHWDGHNHYIYGKVTRDRPVRLLEATVAYEEQTGGQLKGRVRVFDLDDDKEVTVRYSTDEWSTSDQVSATPVQDSDDWTFHVDGLGDATSLPDAVEFAVRYEVGASEFWDNKDGGNYRRRLNPELTTASQHQTYDLDQPIAGILSLGSQAATDIPIASREARLDDGPWTDTTALAFSTLDMKDGPHAVTFRITLEGGFEATATQAFTVENRVVPMDAWAPAFDGAVNDDDRGSSWVLAASDDRVAIGWDAPFVGAEEGYRGVVGFPKYGSNEATLFDALANDAQPRENLKALGIDGLGRTYGLSDRGPALLRWTKQGALDPEYGAQGRLALGDAALPDFPLTMTVSDDETYVIGRCFGSTCPDSVYRFDAEGQRTGAFPIPDDIGDFDSGARQAGAMFHDAEGLWILMGRSILHMTAEPGGDLAVQEQIPLGDGFAFNLNEHIVRVDDGTFFALEGEGNRLVAISPDGDPIGGWYSRVNVEDVDLPGAVHVAADMAVLPDGNIGVLDAHGGRVARFSSTLE